MSEVSTPVQDAIAATKTVSDAAEPVREAAADVVQKTVVAPVAAALKLADKPQAAKPVAKITAKRAYKKRASATTSVKRPVAVKTVAAKTVAAKTVAAKVATRKYTRKSAAVAAATTAPLIKGMKTMTNEAPNWFAGLTAMPGADKVQGMFAGVGEKGQEVVKKSQAFAEQMSDSAKANMEAMVESTRIAAAGARDLGQEMLASSKSGVEHASAAVKSLSEAKSPTEFFQIQSDLIKTSFDRMVAESSKFTEHMVKLTGEAVQPLSNRASVNAEKLNELTA